ncbi:DUF6484 domain-containing protein [Caballeronia sp. GaOx3]|uniref:DUF6484 domain-containing protein n=1 Tax=Caballeronia sp. GaOx3 TaxID=2921740 RepID=UPI002027F593|nr:DUF6484 domain-containing protein [Caballeronia sp. GaOx3]
MSARDMEPAPGSDDPPLERGIRAGETIRGLVAGRVVGLATGGDPLVTFAGQPGSAALIARSTVAVRTMHIGADVALLFERNDVLLPVIVGVIRTAHDLNSTDRAKDDSNADGHRVTIRADEEIVLQCGKCSITLNNTGKIIIRGEYLSSQSNGVNRICGGSVQIN